MDQNSIMAIIPQGEKMLNGRKRKRSNIEPGFPKPCDICNVVLNRKAEYEGHINGKRHAKEVRKKQIWEKLQIESKSGEQAEDLIVIDPITSLRKCSVCSIPFTSPMVEESHMNSKRHKKMVGDKRSGKRKRRRRGRVRKQVGSCEICGVCYTSVPMMKTHLLGRKHKKMCGISNVPGGRGFPTRSEELPPVKKMMLRPVIEPSSVKPTVAKPPKYEVLEKQVEEAYEHYESVACNIPLAEAQALYNKYQAIYSAYEAAYKEHMASREDTK